MQRGLHALKVWKMSVGIDEIHAHNAQLHASTISCMMVCQSKGVAVDAVNCYREMVRRLADCTFRGSHRGIAIVVGATAGRRTVYDRLGNFLVSLDGHGVEGIHADGAE